MLQWFANVQYDTFVNKFQQGQGTVPMGQTFVDVPGSFPLTYQVSLSPVNDPGVRYWVSFKSTSKFTITLSAAAPAAATFDYIVKGT
jgi:hypothetical protein